MSAERKNRLKRIVDLLVQQDRMSVKEIAMILTVSEMTIRRDLNTLQHEGVITRTHGGATLYDSMNTGSEMYVLGEQTEKNARLKSAIGQRAAALIEPRETIFLDSGSTTPFIAKYLDGDTPLTVLCYTFKNASIFHNRRNTNLILAGGYFHRDSNVFHSHEGCELIKKIRADKAFISTGGIDEHLGLTTYFYFEADIKRAMIESAKQIILVTDSSKFNKVSITHFASLKEINTIITDRGIPDSIKSTIQEIGIELIIAD